MKAFECPNCGAPMPPAAGKCEYCESYVQRDSSDNLIFRLDTKLGAAIPIFEPGKGGAGGAGVGYVLRI